MQKLESAPLPEWDCWLCPSLATHWKLGQSPKSDCFVLQSPGSDRIFTFRAAEGYALQHFTGRYTVRQIRERVKQGFPEAEPNLVINLIERLIEQEVLAIEDSRKPESENLVESSIFKPTVEWHYNPDGYWILRNSEERTFLQVSQEDKAAIEQMGTKPLDAIATELNLPPHHLKSLLTLLSATGMLPGTQPVKRHRGKFNPLQLLFFKLPLFNPDPWLNRQMRYLRWLWTTPFAIFLGTFLTISLITGLNQRDAILAIGQRLLQEGGASLFLPFALLSLFVVTLHELGHAFTLKQYGRQVPEVGLLLMCLFPAAYTDTTEQYCLPRRKRILVVAAGVLVQVSLAAIALLFWNLSVPGSWLHTTSYLLIIAALFTIAVNLNPLAKFDGYYLAVAVTGINNLRSRSFAFYVNLLTRQPLRERTKDYLILALYAPFSLLYIGFVFGFLFYRILDWTFFNIPAIALLLLIAWLLYYFSPQTHN